VTGTTYFIAEREPMSVEEAWAAQRAEIDFSPSSSSATTTLASSTATGMHYRYDSLAPHTFP